MKKMVITLLTVAMITGALMAFPKGHGREMRNDRAGCDKGNMEMRHHMDKGDCDRGMRKGDMLRKKGKGAMMQRMIYIVRP